MKSGFVSSVDASKSNVQTEWLCGGATVWRREIVNSQKYDEWFIGTAYFEDIDFSYQVSRNNKLYVLHNACLQHNPPPVITNRGRYIGEMNMTYRHYFVKKHFKQTFPLFYWSSIGYILSNFITFFKKGKWEYFYRGVGNVLGLLRVVTGKKRGITVDFK